MMSVLTIMSLILAGIHFGMPLAYYYYVKRNWLNKPWNVKTNGNYKPNVTVIIPTYNEADLIEAKLNNIKDQEYSKDKLEVIVVDSASEDNTPNIVEKWAEKNSDLKLVLLKEFVRRGMVFALNYASKYVSKDSEVVIFTDVDAFWEQNTLKRVVKYFADPSIGAVTTGIVPLEKDDRYFETTYRNYYNVIRIAESKLHSTPIHNGTLVAFRRELLEKINGLPIHTGNADSTPASLIAFMNYRAIQIDDTIVKEPIRGNQVGRKVRRAQHLILHFLQTKRYAKRLDIYRKSVFDKIWKIECWLHIVNPWLLLSAIVLILSDALLFSSPVSLTLIIAGLTLLALKKIFRVWSLQQLYLIMATVRNLWTREIAWKK